MGERLFDRSEPDDIVADALHSLEEFDIMMERRRELEQEAQIELEGGFLGPTILDPDHPEYLEPLGNIELGLPADTDEPIVF